MTNYQKAIEEILDKLVLETQPDLHPDGALPIQVVEDALGRATTQLLELLNKRAIEGAEKVDRFEVIDKTGRAYVRGSIYDDPVSVELSYQDDGRTLKVFVKERTPSSLLGGDSE